MKAVYGPCNTQANRKQVPQLPYRYLTPTGKHFTPPTPEMFTVRFNTPTIPYDKIIIHIIICHMTYDIKVMWIQYILCEGWFCTLAVQSLEAVMTMVRSTDD